VAEDRTQVSKVELELKRRTHDLAERVKELNCLHYISKLIDTPDITLEGIIKGILKAIPPSFQYPQITCARIHYEGEEYKTYNYRNTPWNMKRSIIAFGKNIGSIEVGYIEERPNNYDGPFLLEELNLLDSITERVGKTIELKRSRSELERLNTELLRKNRYLEQILYASSHDIRAPLVNVQGFGKELEESICELMVILEQTEIPDDGTDRFNELIKKDIPETMGFIQAGILKIESLNKGLLLVSRLGQKDLSLSKVDMNRLIRGLLTTFEFQLKDHSIKVTVGDLPPCWGDADQVYRVFSNIVDNAIKYCDPKKKKKTIILTGHSEGGRSSYSIEDNGIGIPEEYQQKIFDMFHRLNPRETEGDGLGLTIVGRILERHNGDIHVESQEGKGSKFFIHLPESKPEEE
jgi:signal transduction histidine kinase